MPHPSHLSPALLSMLGGYRLIAEKILDGVFLGLHRSPLSGIGLEFNQYRSYQPGDDLRRVDWKMLARSDRYFVRECDIETGIGCRIIIDTSRSMMHEEDGVEKLTYARMLAAALVLLMYRQGDYVGLLALGSAPIDIPMKRSNPHLNRIFIALETLRAGGSWPAWEQIEPLMTAKRMRTLSIVITDMYALTEGNEIETFIKKCSAFGNEVIVFHLYGAREAGLDYDEEALEDLETGKRISFGKGNERKEYQARFTEFMSTLKSRCIAEGIGYFALTLQTPMDVALRRFFLEHQRK